MSFEEIVNEYLVHCASLCNKGGSYLLYCSQKSLQELLINKFKNNGYDPVKVSGWIEICEKEIFSYIDKHKGFYSWSLVDEEELINRIVNRINNAPQQDFL